MNNMLINNLSIKRKLTLIILFISITALLLACFTFILFDRLRFKKIMVHDLGILAEIIGNNCTAALVFNTRGDAQETISSLKAHEHIISACIYDTANQEFARYIKRDSDRDDVNHIFQLALEKLDFAPSPDLSTQFIPRNNKQEKLSCFLSDYLVLFHPILLDNERIGILYLQSDIQELTSRFRQFLGILSITLIGIFVIILMLTARFQSLISEPILHLTQTARNVSSQKDYSIRAVKKFNDEIGFLIDNFNDMLARIENRDKALKNTSEELQQKAVQLKEELRERRRAEKKIKSSLHEKEINPRI